MDILAKRLMKIADELSASNNRTAESFAERFMRQKREEQYYGKPEEHADWTVSIFRNTSDEIELRAEYYLGDAYVVRSGMNVNEFVSKLENVANRRIIMQAVKSAMDHAGYEMEEIEADADVDYSQSNGISAKVNLWVKPIGSERTADGRMRTIKKAFLKLLSDNGFKFYEK